MHVVDTDVCVDALRGKPRAVEGLASLEREGPLAVSSITAHELWQGAFGSSSAERAVAGVARFLSAFEVLPYDQDACREGGRIAAFLGGKGKPIGDLDTMIAATALVNDSTIVTRNTRHFQQVPGLRVRTP